MNAINKRINKTELLDRLPVSTAANAPGTQWAVNFSKADEWKVDQVKDFAWWYIHRGMMNAIKDRRIEPISKSS